MRPGYKINLFFYLLALVSTLKAFAHPTGNLIRVGDHVLWSYVDPIEDAQHHASIMIWSQGSDPQVLMRSGFRASDFMLSSYKKDVYIIERRYVQNQDKFLIRILKMQIGGKPQEIWPWFEDDMRIGEGGFFMRSDEEIIFARYPNIYSLKMGGSPTGIFDLDFPIKRIRAIQEIGILILSTDSCHLVGFKGKLLKKWEGLLDDQIKEAPLDRNQIFDADYYNGELLFAYWGNRSFESITEKGKREILLQQEMPMTPHWVAFFDESKLLFSSKLTFNGRNPRPHLVLYAAKNKINDIWIH